MLGKMCIVRCKNKFASSDIKKITFTYSDVKKKKNQDKKKKHNNRDNYLLFMSNLISCDFYK